MVGQELEEGLPKLRCGFYVSVPLYSTNVRFDLSLTVLSLVWILGGNLCRLCPQPFPLHQNTEGGGGRLPDCASVGNPPSSIVLGHLRLWVPAALTVRTVADQDWVSDGSHLTSVVAQRKIGAPSPPQRDTPSTTSFREVPDCEPQRPCSASHALAQI